MNVVMTLSKPKTDYIQIRVREDIKRDVQIVAELRGLSVSALIHSLLMKVIREEKEIAPRSFRAADSLSPMPKEATLTEDEDLIVAPIAEDPELRLTETAEKKRKTKKR